MLTRIVEDTRLQQWLNACAGRQDIVLSVGLLTAIVMMLLPLPTWMVDMLITVNLMFSVILLLIATYLNEALDLSVFPSLLLITTLYRLALTISTSRLVLLQHNAGNIVEAFGNFVVGGNLTVGLVVFAIITIVQFIVITKGTERVAEVSARFSLDGMPGKQMSIDGDMRAGVIDAAQARQLRQHVQKESRFLGAMDGAMKFVKGDTIASIIVVLVNIIGGIIIAVLQYNMSLEEAVRTYSVLSVGDGLCAQIPSLLISLSAGIIVTRIPGDKRQNLATELSTQIARQPQALVLSALVLGLLAFIPGFPFAIFAFFAVLLIVPIALMRRQKRSASSDASNAAEEHDSMTPGGACPLTLRLTPALHSPGLAQEIDAMRWRLFEDFGVPLPDVVIEVMGAKFAEPTDTLCVLLYQEPILTLSVPREAHYLLLGADTALEGERQVLPDGMGEISWFSEAMGDKVQSYGLEVKSGSQRITALLECALIRHMSEFIGVQETRYLMDSMEKRYSELVKELQRQLPISKITETLQRLVSERVSIRDLRQIFGTLIDWSPKEKDVLMLTEYVRISLRRHLLHRLNPHAQPLPILWIGEGIENLIRESIRQTAMGTYAALLPQHKSLILERIGQALKKSPQLQIVTSVDARRFLRKITENTFPNVSVLSWQELGEECEVRVVDSIDLCDEEVAGNGG